MASDTQETLYKIFAGLAGGSVSGAGASGDGLAGGAIGSAMSAATGEQKTGGGAAGIALKIVKSGMGAVPLVAALLGLFGGGNDEEKPAPLVKYAMPERREFQAAATGSGFAEVDYDQAGMPRVYERRVEPAGRAAAPEQGPAGALPPITVNVQAMDARSFLDRSSEIAAAVREAMLNLNSINDVVTDL
jgi:hypothetical protein